MSSPAGRTIVHIFGGSFNPPHVAHVLAVCLGKCIHPAARTIVIPAFQHPFAKTLAAFEARVRMCEAAFGWVPGTEVSRVEETLGGESRTLRTLQHLAEENPQWEMRLLVGADILAEAEKWFGWPAIIKLAPPLVLGRAGAVVSSGPLGALPPMLPAISSTQIRQALAGKNPSAVYAYLPLRVLEYIHENDLYSETHV